MIVADRFVLLHLHKSGGSFANALVLRHCAGARAVGYHLPHDMIPEGSGHLPILGFVRNPWSYYVSWYAFQQQRPRPNLLFRVLSREGTAGFAGTIASMLELGEREDLLGILAAQLPQDHGNQGLNLPGNRLAAIRGTGQGFYSFLHDYMFGDDPRPDRRIGHMESLREELPRMLAAVGEPLSSSFHADVRGMAPLNVSRHEAYADYYDAGLRELVARRDARLIDRYGYRFGS
jgi:hypothetical protein